MFQKWLKKAALILSFLSVVLPTASYCRMEGVTICFEGCENVAPGFVAGFMVNVLAPDEDLLGANMVVLGAGASLACAVYAHAIANPNMGTMAWPIMIEYYSTLNFLAYLTGAGAGTLLRLGVKAIC